MKYRCPFCGGTKTTPFVSTGKSQDCRDCDESGMISDAKIKEYGIESFIDGYKKTSGKKSAIAKCES